MAEALDYWESNASTYTTFDDVSFSYEPNENIPEIQFRIVEEIRSCGEHDTDAQIAGCAPLLHDGERVSQTIEIEIIGELEDRSLRHTLKHELGHVLGLDHHDEPQEVMSYDPSLRIPDYEQKTRIIEEYNIGVRRFSSAFDEYNEGVEYYEADNFAQSADLFETAANWAIRAQSSFQSAESVSLQIDESTAADFSEEAKTKCGWMEESFVAIANASVAYENRNWNRGDRYIQSHQDAHQRINNFAVRDPALLRDELGLPS